jgi:aldehyde dehydrogenase (NAD+)
VHLRQGGVIAACTYRMRSLYRHSRSILRKEPSVVRSPVRCQSSEVAQLFNSMSYGPAPEDNANVDAWLDSHNRRFGMFINNQWVESTSGGTDGGGGGGGGTGSTSSSSSHGEDDEDSTASSSAADAAPATASSINPATGEFLAETVQATVGDMDAAVAAAKEAFPSWSATTGHERARYLYSIARHLQKHHRLMACLESVDNGKTIRETRDADVPLAVRHFYSHAGWAQLMDTEMIEYKPLGVIGQIIPWNFPLLMLAWKVAPAIAMGNTLVIKPAPSTRLSAWLFADILVEAGLPKGVVNIVTGDNDVAAHLVEHPDVDKVAFTGSTGVGKHLRRLTAGTGKKLSLELGGKSPVVVFDSADLDSAVEGLVNAIWFNQGQVCCAGSRLLVQENIADAFLGKVRARMQTLRLGDSLDKCMDMGAIVDETQRGRIEALVDIGREEGADVFQVGCPSDGCYYPPTLITNVQSTSTLVQEEIFGPVLVAQTFRTPAEGIALANNTRYGLSAGVWTESVGLAMEAATAIRAGVIWVNCHNMFDAAAGFGGYKESGFGREGGKEGLYQYVLPKWAKSKTQGGVIPAVTEAQKSSKWGVPGPALPGAATSGSSVFGGEQTSGGSNAGLPAIDRTAKMYIGGSQKRPDGAYVLSIQTASGEVLSQVGDGNRKDIRDAVEAAHKAAPGWGKRAAYNRSQILYYIAENLSARQSEFAERIATMTGVTHEEGMKEVTASIDRLFHYAAYADKYGGVIQETPLYGLTCAINEPAGVIGICCPETPSLLGFVSLVAPAVVRGNTVVVIPSEKHPLVATDLYQVLDTSDLPGGVINIVTGQTDVMAKTLVEHQHVDAMWCVNYTTRTCFHFTHGLPKTKC